MKNYVKPTFIFKVKNYKVNKVFKWSCQKVKVIYKFWTVIVNFYFKNKCRNTCVPVNKSIL